MRAYLIGRRYHYTRLLADHFTAKERKLRAQFLRTLDDQRNQLAGLRYEGQFRCVGCDEWFVSGSVMVTLLDEEEELHCEYCYEDYYEERPT